MVPVTIYLKKKSLNNLLKCHTQKGNHKIAKYIESMLL